MSVAPELSLPFNPFPCRCRKELGERDSTISRKNRDCAVELPAEPVESAEAGAESTALDLHSGQLTKLSNLTQ